MKSEEIFHSNLEESSVTKPGMLKKTHLKEKNKNFTIKDTFPARKNMPRVSLIPKLKINNSINNEAEGVERKFSKSIKPSNISSVSLNAGDKYSAICQKPVEDKKFKLQDAASKKSQKKQETHSRPSSQKMHVRQSKSPDIARRMISVPVFNKIPLEDGALSNFENSVRQISEVWLKTSADLSNALKNLKNKPSLDPMEFQQESIKIQMAVQQAKSLTILKTKSVMAEAKILLHNGEAIGSELECFLRDETFKSEKDGDSWSEIPDESQNKPTENQKNGGMGDLPRRKEKSAENIKEIDGDNSENENSGSQTTRIDKTDSFLLKKKDEMSGSWKDPERPDDTITLEKMTLEMMSELSKKNETISQLNNKVFQLQKTCKEHIQLRNYLQDKLAEYHEKIQWYHILWKQIGKLKTRLKEFQESHEKLESEKRALEAVTANQEKEIEKLKKMNHFLNQKTILSAPQGFFGNRDENGTREAEDLNEKCAKEKILEEKQNSINVLKMVLNMMMDQESLAQKQIAMFQTKIQELEKATKL